VRRSRRGPPGNDRVGRHEDGANAWLDANRPIEALDKQIAPHGIDL
jgi:hypothetical protein